MPMTAEHLAELRQAKVRLEKIPLHVRLANALGQPLENAMSTLPRGVQARIVRVVQRSLDTAVGWAVATMDVSRPRASRAGLHRAAAIVSGGVGGAFGVALVGPELAVSTTVMLRSIADIARENGEDLASPEARLQCVAVLSYGGPSESDDAAETTYYTTRAVLAKTIHDASVHVAARAAGERVSKTTPALVRFMNSVAGRFGLTVQQKYLAQLLPLVGAAGGATVNAVFISHFQEVARGHFVIRRLERLYGVDVVREAYDAVRP